MPTGDFNIIDQQNWVFRFIERFFYSLVVVFVEPFVFFTKKNRCFDF